MDRLKISSPTLLFFANFVFNLQMENHVNHECPSTVIPCQYKPLLGCETEVSQSMYETT